MAQKIPVPQEWRDIQQSGMRGTKEYAEATKDDAQYRGMEKQNSMEGGGFVQVDSEHDF